MMNGYRIQDFPGRRSLVFRDATIITMDPELGDLYHADLWIQNGLIREVGQSVQAPEAEEIDGTGRILIPGMIDTHQHLWNSILRGLINGSGERGYFPVKRRLAPLFTPEDSYAAGRFALAEALSSGITTVVNWNHNLRSPEDADANIRAQLDSGLRTRLAYGNADALDPTVAMDLADVLRVRERWAGQDERLDVGVALRGPTRTERDIMLTEWAFAREHGLPITMHLGGKRSDVGRYADITAMHADGLLGPDVQLVHAVDANAAEIALLAQTGTTISLSTLTEIPSMGIPPVGALAAAGVTTSLSIDTLALPSNADMFAQMRGTLRIAQFSGSHDIDSRHVLRMATIDGARDLGLAGQIGSLTPGKRADVTSVRSTSLTMTPGVDPVLLLVACATPADVDLVVVDGRLLLEDAAPTFFAVQDVTEAARSALAGLLDRAGWDILSSAGQAGKG